MCDKSKGAAVLTESLLSLQPWCITSAQRGFTGVRRCWGWSHQMAGKRQDVPQLQVLYNTQQLQDSKKKGRSEEIKNKGEKGLGGTYGG